MDCRENQYYYNGECHLCQQCGPGQELSEECGYGSGGGAYCAACGARSYKEDWGQHNCKLCLSCKHVNRRVKSHCSHRSNTICGECLPGFYSKTRIDGLQDLECIPCGPSSGNERHCTRGKVTYGTKDWPTEAPPPKATVSLSVCGALVSAAIVLSVVFLVRFRRALLRKMFEGPQSSNQEVAGGGNGETLTLNLKEQVPVSGKHVSSAVEALGSSFGGSPIMETAVVMMSELQACCPGGYPDTQPLVSNSTCSSCSSSGWACQRSRGSSTAISGEDLVEERPPPFPLNPSSHHCASDWQEGCCHHTPVECTELDFSCPVAPEWTAGDVEVTVSMMGRAGCPLKHVPAEPPNGLTAHPERTTSSNNHLESGRSSNTVSDVQTEGRKSFAQTLGADIGMLPQNLMESQGLQPTPPFALGTEHFGPAASEPHCWDLGVCEGLAASTGPCPPVNCARCWTPLALRKGLTPGSCRSASALPSSQITACAR